MGSDCWSAQLVVGTALPHLLRGIGQALPWAAVLVAVSSIASLAGIAMLLLVPDGPHLACGTAFDPRAF